MPSDLAATDAAAWAELASAAADPESGFRYLNLCSVDAGGRPQARMVVLRRADPARRLLEFHTDVRSRKWLEFSADPRATVLGFCTRARLQLRLQGEVALHSPGSEIAGLAWEALPARTRRTYAGGPPGDERALDAIDAVPSAAAGDETKGSAHFGVVAFRATVLDWFQLRRQGNRRAVFTYGATGVLASGRRLNP